MRRLFTVTLNRAWLAGLLAGLYSIPAVIWPEAVAIGAGIEAALTFAIGIMLAVRVNQAYLRWWEGRSLWGKLVNVCRNLALKLREYVELTEDENRVARQLCGGFPWALRNHLRGPAKLQDLPGYEDDPARPDHVPAYLAGRVYHALQRLHTDGRLNDAQMWMIDREARELMEVCGGCEKIRNTPMAESFPVFVRCGIVLLLLTLPWDLADKVGWWAIPAMVLTGFFAVGGEAIAAAMEQPFGTTADNLDLDGICRAIEKSTTEILA